MWYRYLGFIILIGSFMIALTGCKQEEQEKSIIHRSLTPIPVNVDQTRKVTSTNQAEVVGTVQAINRAEISSKITGNITRLTVDLGSKVNEGDLLAILSAGEISAQVQQAKAQYNQAKRNLKREESLLEKNAATEESVKSFRDQKVINEGAYKEAVTMLDYTRITAPFSGIITKKMANVGDLATPGKPLIQIEDPNNLEIQTAIPEAMILKIAKGDKLTVFIPSVNLRIKGTVAEVSPTADPSSRTAPIKLQIKSNPLLRSGQFARITLVTGESQTLMIPSTSVTVFGQLERVFVVENDLAKLRLIRTGVRVGDNIEVLTGLNSGESVITSKANRILDGQPVIIRQ